MSNQRTMITKVTNLKVMERALKSVKTKAGSALFVTKKKAEVMGWSRAAINNADLAFNLAEQGTPYRFGFVKSKDKKTYSLQGDFHWIPGLKSMNAKNAKEFTERVNSLYNRQGIMDQINELGLNVVRATPASAIAEKPEVVIELDV